MKPLLLPVLAALGVLLFPGTPFAADLRIQFLPPPMEGTLSLGIDDPAGKRVRVLHREADLTDLTAEADGLVTQWDGKDDQGALCPAGKYHARGYLVGELKAEGIDIRGNDWVTDDDSPRITRITTLAIAPDGSLLLTARKPDQSSTLFGVQISGTEAKLLPAQPLAPDAKLLPGGLTAPGRDNTTWAIREGKVEQQNAKGERLCELPQNPDDAPPIQLVTSPNNPYLFILGQNNERQELTVWEPGKEEPLLQQTIEFCDRFEQVAPKLTFPDGKPFTPLPSLPVTLVKNPLFKNKPGSVEVRAVLDAKGSHLATADGLPLFPISETPHLRWVQMGRAPGAKAITVFQSDGAATEQFSIENLSQMMAFDAGEIELAAPAPMASTTPVPSATPSPSPTSTPAPSASPSPSVAPTPDTVSDRVRQ